MGLNSINTNTGAMIALQNLNVTNSALNTTQNRINTGQKVSSAKDNGAIWAIAQNSRADIGALDSVKDSVQRGQSTVDVAISAGETISDLLSQMKAKSLAAASRADGVAAEQGFRNKVTGLDKFFSRLAGARHQFHPISYETGGRLHPESRLYFEQIVKDIIDTPPEAWSKEDMAFYQASLDAILDAASVALAKSVASTLRPGLQAGAQHGDDADTISDLEDDVNDGDATMMQ